MSRMSLAAPVPSRIAVTSEFTAVLEKRVMTRGLCTTAQVNEDDDPWYPLAEAGAKAVDAARKACAGCTVMASCLELALREEGQLGGVFGARGGLAAHERRILIRNRRRGGELR